jgi:hypothetical protein
LAVIALTDDDKKAMNDSNTMNAGFSANLTLGGKSPEWKSGNTRGYFEFEAQGHSADNQYRECRRVRPRVYGNGNQPMNVSNAQPVIACKVADGRWKIIQPDQFVCDNSIDNYYRPQPMPQPQYTPPRPIPQPRPAPYLVSYQNQSPYTPFYGGRPVYVRQQPQYVYQQPHYHYQQPQYQPYSGYNDGGLNFDFGVNLTL